MKRRSTTTHLLLALALVAGYGGFLLERGPGAKEAFPVFEWELFSKVPARVVTGYGIRITAVDGQHLYFPRYFEKARGLVKQPGSIEAATMTRTMGQAFTRGNPARGEEVRARFEDAFLADKAFEYELVLRTYDVKERMACDCFVEETVLKTFTTGPRA